MGKSGGKKKKGASNKSIPDANNGGIDLEPPSIFLKRAHQLKHEGNLRFQDKDYVGALEQYDKALGLTPKTHPDRALFHSNRAACLMQMKPVDYDTVIAECSMALQVQPRFVRALVRRARALEMVGKYEMALQDVQTLLGVDPNHGDALEIARRLQACVGPRHEDEHWEAQQDLPSRPSPAAVGASAVRGAPISGLGACLPARPVPKKGAASGSGSVVSPNNKLDKLVDSRSEVKTQFSKLVLKPSNGSTKSHATKDDQKEGASSLVPLSTRGQVLDTPIRWRPLKLVYDHDIRLAQMPVNCNFRVLRDVVTNRFPSSKSVLIKYRDSDGDLVTITCTGELRLAESCVDSLLTKVPESDKTDSIGMLRLHIVEVSPEQEPPIVEEEKEEEEEKPVESEEIRRDESGSQTSLGDSAVDIEIDKTEKKEEAESKEVEMDDWLFEFAQLFRTHVGIDPDAHIDLHELGMELCSEALEETVTSEEAQSLFDKAALKFQEVAALAFFNWGNVHMCAARKRIPIDDSAAKELVKTKIQEAYDWVREKYSLAKEKYEEALLIKPDFYEGLLALGQQQFEMAKLHWSYILAKKEDLSKWDSTETIKLFDSAEEKMRTANEMWEKMEEQRARELKDPPSASKREELLKSRKKQGSGNDDVDISADEAAEQAAVMRSQIHLFWGNMLFERSQVGCKLGLNGWEKNLDDAVERFKLAGASEADISSVLKNHCSKCDAVEGGEKKVETLSIDIANRTDNEANSSQASTE